MQAIPVDVDELAALRREVDRLRAGLQWYADGNHFDLDDWDSCSGESQNWLFPPTDDSWMVDDGGIAQSVLAGGVINPNCDESETIVLMPITDKEQHKSAMDRINELMPLDPLPETAQGKELMILAEQVEKYEIASIAKARP